jgi:hypothetical protein
MIYVGDIAMGLQSMSHDEAVAAIEEWVDERSRPRTRLCLEPYPLSSAQAAHGT